jgi:hypothetical protein
MVTLTPDLLLTPACPLHPPIPFQVLDIASMTLFLMTMDCGYFSVPSEHIGVNQEFTDVSKCDR